MNNSIIVLEQDNILVVDSRLIAAELGIPHKTFVRTIRRHQTVLEANFGHARLEDADVKIGNGATRREFSHYWLTEDQSMFLMTLSRNTPQVIACKVNLVKAFSFAKQNQVKPERIDICNLDERTMHLLLSWQFWRQFPTRKEAYAYFYDPYSPQIGICTPYEAATLDDRLKSMSDFVFEYVIAFDSIRDPRSSAEGRQRCLEWLTQDRVKAAKSFQHQLDNPQLLLSGSAIEYPDLASRQRSLVLAAASN